MIIFKIHREIDKTVKKYMYTQINNGHRLNGREHETEWQPASAGNKFDIITNSP